MSDPVAGGVCGRLGSHPGVENKDISGASEDRELAEIEDSRLISRCWPRKRTRTLCCAGLISRLHTALQYGDLVVDVGDYLGSGTSSVGAAVALLEQALAMWLIVFDFVLVVSSSGKIQETLVV